MSLVANVELVVGNPGIKAEENRLGIVVVEQAVKRGLSTCTRIREVFLLSNYCNSSFG